MKKLLYAIFSILLFSCSRPSDVKETEGEIIEVVQDSKTYIKVKFHHAGDDRISYTTWFEGADTCKVGQKVRLQ